MKKIITTDIVAGVQMPIKKGTLDHLQSSYQEILFGLAQSELFQRTGVTTGYAIPQAMYGLGYGVLGTIWTIESGMLVYGNELFLCDTVVGLNLTIGQVVIGTITTTNLTATDADPVEFSDATLHNVLEIRKIVWSAGASGSSDFDFLDIEYLGRWIPYTYSASYLSATTGAWTVATPSNFQVKTQRRGSTVKVSFYILASTVTSTNAELILTLPFTDKIKGNSGTLCHAEYTTTSTRHYVKVVAVDGTRDIKFSIASPFFTATANGLDLIGEIEFEMDCNES